MSSEKEIEQAIKAIALHVKNELGRLEEEIKSANPEIDELRREINELKQSQDYSPHIDELREHKHKISSDVGELKKHVEYIKASSSPERLGKLEQLVKTELAKFDEKLNMSGKDFSKMGETAEQLRKQFEQIDLDISRRTGEFDKHMSEALSRMRDFDAGMAKKLEEADGRITQRLDQLDKGMNERMKKLEGTDTAGVYRRLEKLEGEISSKNTMGMARRLETLEDEIKKLEEIRKLLEDESVYRTSVEKKLAGLEMKAADVQKAKPAALEAEITPIIARRLEEFARVMDRKMPELLTKDEFEKYSAQMSAKLKYIEAPDTAGIEKRMDSVERKLDQLTSVLKDLLNRMPVVVE